MAKQVGNLGSINLDLLAAPGAALKLIELFRDERVDVKHAIRVVKPYLKKSPTQATSATIFASFLAVFGVEPAFSRILLANLERHNQQDRVRSVLEQLNSQQQEAKLDTLTLMQALAAVAPGGVNSHAAEQIYRRCRASTSAEVRQWAGMRLGSLLGVPLAAIQAEALEDAADQMPAQLHGSVVVLAESGVRLENLATWPGLKNSKVTLYSDDDFGSQPDALNAVLGSYRDKVPDHSPASKRIYAFASAMGSKLASSHIGLYPEQDQQWIRPFEATLALAYEDHLAAILTKLECFDACLQEAQDPDFIIVAGNSVDPLIRMIPYLCRQRCLDNVYFVPLYDLPDGQEASLRLAQQLVRPEQASVVSGAEDSGPTSESTTPTTIQQPHQQKLRRELAVKLHRDAMIAQGEHVLLAGHLHNKNYAATTAALLAELERHGQQTVVYDASHLPFAAEKTEQYRNLVDLKPLVDADEPFSAFFDTIANELTQSIDGGWDYEQVSLQQLLRATLSVFVKRDLRHTISRFIYFDELFQLAPPKVAILSTSRWVAVRGLSVIATQFGVPTIDIQSLNVLRHPKYKIPEANWATVIDQMSRDIYQDYLGFPSENIFVTGTPRVDDIRDRAKTLNAPDLRTKFKLPPDDRPTLLFASQLQPLERCLSILNEMCHVVKESGANLLIKLHPREGNSRREAYEKLVRDNGVADHGKILGAVPIEETLAVSHTVVTMFSNVAREALLVGREVIIANYFDTELPIRFDLDSGAVGAYSPSELRKKLASSVASWKPGAAYEAPESAYMRSNPHLKQGNSVERIIAHALRISIAMEQSIAAFPTIDDEQITADNTQDLMVLVRYGIKLGQWDQANSLLDRLIDAELSNEILSSDLPAMLALLEPNWNASGQATRATASVSRAISRSSNAKLIRQVATNCANALADKATLRAISTALRQIDNPSSLLFDAYLHIACGALNRARGTVANATQQPTDTEVGIELQQVNIALSPTRATSQTKQIDSQAFESIDNAILIVEKGVSTSVVADEVATGKYNLVVCEATETIAALRDLKVEMRSLKDYFDDFSPVVANVLRVVADGFASTFADTLAEILSVEAGLDFGKRHKPALSNWMRQALADPTHRCFVVRSILRESTTRPAVLLAYRPTSISNYWEVEVGNKNLWFIAAEDNPARLPRLQEAIHQQIAEIHTPTAVSTTPLKANHLREEFAKARSVNTQPIINATGTDRALIVVRWLLKTTPPTFARLISRMPQQMHTALIGADVLGGEEDITAHLGEAGEQRIEEGRLRCYTKPMLTASAPPEWVAQRVEQLLIERCLNAPMLREQGLDMRAMAKQRIGTFTRLALLTLILVDDESKRYLASPGRAIVAVTPGRHPEAIIAQTNAEALGKQSLDIQVAYWSKSFRYLPPYGSLMSVIDRWSEDMIVDHFKMPAEAVYRLGTPRFDAIANQFSAHSPTTVTPSGLVLEDPDKPLVTFATQPGLLAQKTAIIKELCESSFDPGPLNLLIKVHPQDTEQVESYQQLVASFECVNTPIFAQNEPMQALINESDVIITIFSNVGIEAAIMGKRLLIVNLGEDMPLPLDKFNIGANAYKPEQISTQLNRLLTEPDFVQDIEASRQAFFKENPQLLRGDSADAIWGLLQKNLA